MNVRSNVKGKSSTNFEKQVVVPNFCFRSKFSFWVTFFIFGKLSKFWNYLTWYLTFYKDTYFDFFASFDLPKIQRGPLWNILCMYRRFERYSFFEKVNISWKQIVASWILPKNKRSSLSWELKNTIFFFEIYWPFAMWNCSRNM